MSGVQGGWEGLREPTCSCDASRVLLQLRSHLTEYTKQCRDAASHTERPNGDSSTDPFLFLYLDTDTCVITERACPRRSA